MLVQALKLVKIKPLSRLIGIRIYVFLRNQYYLTADFVFAVLQNPPSGASLLKA